MPSPSPTILPATDAVPTPLLELQRGQEELFIAARALRRQMQEMQARQLQPRCRPRPLPRPLRAVLRLVPPLRRAWQARIVARSGLFDAEWYLAQYPDVTASGADPLRHFLRHGGLEGRSPGPDFDTAHYRRLYPDVVAAGINPLVHYLTAGWDEGRSTHPHMPERCR